MNKKKVIESVFKHCVDDKTLKLISENASSFSFSGGTKHISVLFSDIISFTNYLIKQPIEETVYNLSEYFTEMSDVIRRYGGFVDKFVRDEIMAEFGTPYPYPDHAERACLAALEMVRSNDLLWEKWKWGFHINIGINTGDMFVGNIGSRDVFDYTAIGEGVNFGLRLNGINKVYRTANNIIISEFTKNELSENLVTRELDTINVKGTSKPVTIFELVSEKDIVVYPEDFLAHYTEGLANYKKLELDEAIKEFKRAIVLYEDDISKMYIKRCNHFKKYPPPPDWGGVFTISIR